MLSEIQRFGDNLSPAAVTPARGDRTGALVTTPAHSSYAEAVYQNNVWTLSTQTNIILAAANVFNANTMQPVLGLWNPPQSKKLAVVTRVVTVWSNGNAPSGGLLWAFVPPMCAVTATGGNSEVNALTLQTGGSPFKTFVNSAMTGIGSASILRFLGGPTAGNFGSGGNQVYSEECAGDIFCPPGAAIGLCTYTTGNNPVVYASVVYETMPT